MIVHFFVLSLLKAIALLPFPAIYRLSNGLSFLVYKIIGYRKEVVKDNLRRAFPNYSEKEISEIAQKFYLHFTDLILEMVKSLRMTEEEARKRLILKNPELFDQLYSQKKGVILVWGHYTNFEWMAMAMPLLVPQRCHAVYQPLSNKYFGETVVKIRQQFGLRLYPMKETYPYMLGNDSSDSLYIFMADQSPSADRIKYSTNFFGWKTPVHLGVENLAKKLDLAVVFLYAERVKRGHYELTARLLTEDPSSMPEHNLTDLHVAWLEEEIKLKPEDWLWSHKRWKHAKEAVNVS
jgi:Kdo2-lipid IVA lauroyltransferase/acyltransferase